MTALGIGHLGRATAKLLIEEFGSLKAVMEATNEEIEAVNGVGPSLSISIEHFKESVRESNLLERLNALGLAPILSSNDVSGVSLNISIVFAPSSSGRQNEAFHRILGFIFDA